MSILENISVRISYLRTDGSRFLIQGNFIDSFKIRRRYVVGPVITASSLYLVAPAS